MFKKNKDKIRNAAELLNARNTSLARKSMYGVTSNVVDQALYTWFLQERNLGNPVSGALLAAKAVELNKQNNGPDSCCASKGWLHGFNQRHGIRQLSIQGEKKSADHKAADEFGPYFRNHLAENDYHLNEVYNADETGLYWKTLPRTTLAAAEVKAVSGAKIIKNRLTAMFCANMTGSHKIPLLVLGKSKQTRCFSKNEMQNLPVTYMAQRKGWMDISTFNRWYKEVFIPEVTEKHPGTHTRPRKVLLLLDNAPSHPPVEDLNSIDETCKVNILKNTYMNVCTLKYLSIYPALG